jgi:uncharacterized protein YoaH (UPF0181 family)
MSQSMNITLPAAMKKWVKHEATRRGFDMDTYMLKLLEREKNMEARERVEELLLEGIHSGESRPVTAATWERIRAKGRKMAKDRRRK